MRNTSLKLIIALLTLLTLFAPACTPPQKPVMGFHPVLSISEPPALGKPVKVSLTFTSVIPKGLENRELYYLASIELIPGVYEVVEGDLQSKGRIVSGETHTLEATIKSVRTTGNGEIVGRVALHFSPDDTGTTGDEDYLFISITKDGATVSRTMPKYSPAATQYVPNASIQDKPGPSSSISINSGTDSFGQVISTRFAPASQQLAISSTRAILGSDINVLA